MVAETVRGKVSYPVWGVFVEYSARVIPDPLYVSRSPDVA